ncbi:LLM class F420-dependent oxidoreductase [Longimycelium tulufanense]|uniref:LLM class F420-dependent oxidoreductase n=1 Tax=Longimycelium tulufanense TaxID=907463 RepID=A0A8J3CIV8_9PSEU|nr:LLM class F420-dependent oxidoreductase [Longimycelium tulufanense]
MTRDPDSVTQLTLPARQMLPAGKVRRVRLGLNLSYWGAGNDADNLELAKEADRLGYAVVWVAEAYGSDAATILSWIAAHTERIDVGSAIFQIPARTPAMTAMTAATLDTLSGGRFRLGLGVSGPQVSEGWYGVRFDKPLARTREYVEIIRKALSRERLTHQGTHWTLPLPDGPGKPIKLTVHPVREHIPIYIAAIGPKNLEQTGEIADGALVLFFSPDHAGDTRQALRAGRAKVGKDLEGFDIVPTVPIVVGDDWKTCADTVRAYAALYIGGMGSRQKNFYNALATRMGYGEQAQEIQDKFLAKDYLGAAAAVPLEFLDATSLLGPKERIAERMRAFADAGVTTLTLSPMLQDVEQGTVALRTAVEAYELAGLAE